MMAERSHAIQMMLEVHETNKMIVPFIDGMGKTYFGVNYRSELHTDVVWYCETLTLVGTLAWVWDQPFLSKVIIKCACRNMKLLVPISRGINIQPSYTLTIRKVLRSFTSGNQTSNHRIGVFSCDTAQQRREFFSLISQDPQFLHSMEQLVSRDT
jgi:hypothetical protein